MGIGLDVWMAAASLSIGAHMMAAPDAAYRSGSGPGPVPTIASVAAYLRTLLLFGLALSIVVVWYKTSYWWAALYVTAGLPGVFIEEGLGVLLRRPRPQRLFAGVVAACLVLGPAIAGLGVYRLVHNLARPTF